MRENPQPSVVHCRQPTLLHFSASWKNSRNSSMPQLATLLDIADAADWWPAELRVQVDPERSEQQAYSTMLTANAEQWTASIRGAVRDLITHLAWDDIQTVRPALKTMSRELEIMRGELASTRTECASANENVQAVQKNLATAKIAIDAAQAENQGLISQLNATSRENEYLAAEVGRVGSDAARLATEVKRAQAEIDRLVEEVRRMRLSLAWRLQERLNRVRFGRRNPT